MFYTLSCIIKFLLQKIFFSILRNFSKLIPYIDTNSGTSLCGLTADERKIPKFFRIADTDLPHFPPKTFSSLRIMEGKSLSDLHITKGRRYSFLNDMEAVVGVTPAST